jgi:hypothetical protein
MNHIILLKYRCDWSEIKNAFIILRHQIPVFIFCCLYFVFAFCHAWILSVTNENSRPKTRMENANRYRLLLPPILTFFQAVLTENLTADRVKLAGRAYMCVRTRTRARARTHATIGDKTQKSIMIHSWIMVGLDFA